jgi:hypothetical protein
VSTARPIRRKNTAKGHYYVDGDGNRVPGVTTILSNLPKDALINWAATTTAGYAVDNWDELAAMKPAARLQVLNKCRYAEKDAAAKRGTEVHAIGEKLVMGEQVEVPSELAGHAEAYARFLDAFKVEPVRVEFGVAHYKWGYAGTADLIADVTIPRIGKKRLLLDIKTSRSGIFGEVALQLAAYRYAEVIIPDAPDGEDEPMIEVDDCAGIHVRADGADLVPLTTNDQVYKSFLYVQAVGRFVDISRDLVGAPIPPDLGTALRVVREDVTA